MDKTSPTPSPAQISLLVIGVSDKEELQGGLTAAAVSSSGCPITATGADRYKPLEKAGQEGLKKATFPQTVTKS